MRGSAVQEIGDAVLIGPALIEGERLEEAVDEETLTSMMNERMQHFDDEAGSTVDDYPALPIVAAPSALPVRHISHAIKLDVKSAHVNSCQLS